MKIKNHLHFFPGKEGSSNSYVILGDKNVLVDTGRECHAAALFEKIKEFNIDLIVNTHCHFDHCGGNGIIKEKTGARIAAHEDAAKYMYPHSKEQLKYTGIWLMEPVEPFKCVEVDRKLKEGDVVTRDYVVLHTPGHSKGGISLYSERDKVLICGDIAYEGGSIGRMDLPGGDDDEMRASLEKIEKLDVEIMLPGHMDIVDVKANENITRCLEDHFREPMRLLKKAGFLTKLTKQTHNS